MRKAHMVGGGVKKDKLTENEYLIYTLAVLPELVFCHGFGILKIYMRELLMKQI